MTIPSGTPVSKWYASPTYLDARRQAFEHLQGVLLEKCASTSWNGAPPDRILGSPPSELRVNEAIYRAAQYVNEPTFISKCVIIFKCQLLQAPTQLFNLLNKYRNSPLAEVPAQDSYLMEGKVVANIIP